MPYFIIHICCVTPLWVGISPIAVWTAVGLYVARMFLITGVYHRYFSHRAYKTSRLFQFILAVLGCTAGQRGPIWWSAHHRHHHRYSDQPEDAHSPHHDGFWMSHAGWFMREENFPIRTQYVKDWLSYPELVWLEKYEIIPCLTLGVLLFAIGRWIGLTFPETSLTGAQLLAWGFVISTVTLYHGTYTINSLSHVWGSRRFQTNDQSRNNLILAIITLGEGWHNNHHWYSSSASQGLRWWEIDISFYILKGLEAVGLIWDLRRYPQSMYEPQPETN